MVVFYLITILKLLFLLTFQILHFFYITSSRGIFAPFCVMALTRKIAIKARGTEMIALWTPPGERKTTSQMIVVTAPVMMPARPPAWLLFYKTAHRSGRRNGCSIHSIGIHLNGKDIREIKAQNKRQKSHKDNGDTKHIQFLPIIRILFDQAHPIRHKSGWKPSTEDRSHP